MDLVLAFVVFLMAEAARFAGRPAGRGGYEEWKPGRKRKILLVGYNGARNTGSDVRVAAIAAQIRELFGKDNVHITVMTLDAASLKGYFDEDVELLPFSSLFPLDLLRACCSHHAAILCEGSTLKSTFANALTLFMGEAAGIMKNRKKPCLAYGSEVAEMEPQALHPRGRTGHQRLYKRKRLFPGRDRHGKTGRTGMPRPAGSAGKLKLRYSL